MAVQSIYELAATFDATYPDCKGDAYAFAEWIVDERETFGDPNTLEGSDLESAWEEAQSWYEQATEVRA